jgi:formylmethanofuran dehydrogenase subunit C
MSRLTLTLKEPPAQRLDLSPLTPDRLKDVGAAELAAIELASGNRRLRVGDLFAVAAGDPSDILIRASSAKLDFIGRDMAVGAIAVEGDVGAYLGQGLSGGRIDVGGSAGPWAAAGMSGGIIEISGNAGDSLGGALPGDMRGMSGGLVIVRGNAGERAGDRQRRGIILVEGDVGAYAGSRMIAGTLMAFGGTIGPYAGFAMKRGTLLFRQAPSRLLPSFLDCGRHELGFLRLLQRTLLESGRPLPMLKTLGLQVHRWAGDQSVEGKGEILVCQP